MTDQHFPHLSRSFYEQSDILQSIRTAGFSRITSPDAVLACLLCRVSASIPPGVTLPNGGTLDFIAALVGVSGSGKSVAFKAAKSLLPDIGTVVDGWGIGSGQGIAQTFVGKPDPDTGLCPIVQPRALFVADEGEQVLKVAKQEGSLTMSTIRAAWSGSALGQTNAAAERNRNVPAGLYRFALTVGFQPIFATQLLTGVYAGDPQRFLFVGVTHPDQPDQSPPFPKPLAAVWLPSTSATELNVDPEVTRQITSLRTRRQRLEIPFDPLDSHRHLVQLKAAGLLSWLHNDDVTIQWWNLAAELVEVSKQVRDRLCDMAITAEQSVAAADVQRSVARTIGVDLERERTITASMIHSIGNAARNADRPVNRSYLQQATASKHRNVVAFDDALAEALRQGVIVRANGTTGLYVAPPN